jgi:hypothetical protein
VQPGWQAAIAAFGGDRHRVADYSSRWRFVGGQPFNICDRSIFTFEE